MTTSRPLSRPLVGIPCDRKFFGDIAFHAAGEKYITSLIDAAAVEPLLIPVPEHRVWTDAAIDTVLAPLDGLLMPGSPSNVDPKHYGGGAARFPEKLDPARDALTLPLLRRAIATALPVFAICRGFQELNAALGGTLHQEVHHLPDGDGHTPRLDHREPSGEPLAVRYAPQHDVHLAPGGTVEAITGSGPLTVNSLHSQGIDSLAPDLAAEARSPDGIIEAVSMPGAPGFVLGVQWHPDWQPLDTPHYAALFQAFGEACRSHQAARADHPALAKGHP